MGKSRESLAKTPLFAGVCQNGALLLPASARTAPNQCGHCLWGFSLDAVSRTCQPKKCVGTKHDADDPLQTNLNGCTFTADNCDDAAGWTTKIRDGLSRRCVKKLLPRIRISNAAKVNHPQVQEVKLFSD